jgi:putative PIN family toxin of toxin-antitoxin system
LVQIQPPQPIQPVGFSANGLFLLCFPLLHLARAPVTPVVLDTNVALDVLLFADPATEPLRDALNGKTLQWIATARMRDELVRVLAYPNIERIRGARGVSVGAIVSGFDAFVRIVDVPAKAPWTCKDADDQVFIDLAFAQACDLVSKDKAVLKLRKRLERNGCRVMALWRPRDA